MGNCCAGDFAHLTFFRGGTAAVFDFVVFAPFLMGGRSQSWLAILALGETRHA